MTLQFASLALMATLLTGQVPQASPEMTRVSGQVIEDGTNTPVAGARMFVLPDDERAAADGFLPEAFSDRDGHYRFDSLPAGRYHIAAQKDGFAPPMDPSTMQMFEVAAGQVLDGLTVSLRRGGAFAGRVLDPQGQPIANVGVTALLKRLNRSDPPAGVLVRPANAHAVRPWPDERSRRVPDLRLWPASM